MHRVRTPQPLLASCRLALRLEGCGGKLRDAISARVAVLRPDSPTQRRRAATDGSSLCAGDPRLIVGVGDHHGAATVRALWPECGSEQWTDLDGGPYHILQAGHGRPVAEPSS